MTLQSLLDVDEHSFLRYVEVRWLTFAAVLERLLEQWIPLTEYFLTELQNDKAAVKIPRCSRIIAFLKRPTTLA